MGLNKNKIFAYAALIMLFLGIFLILLGLFKYREISGIGFVAIGIGFLANSWVFHALKGRV